MKIRSAPPQDMTPWISWYGMGEPLVFVIEIWMLSDDWLIWDKYLNNMKFLSLWPWPQGFFVGEDEAA